MSYYDHGVMPCGPGFRKGEADQKCICLWPMCETGTACRTVRTCIASWRAIAIESVRWRTGDVDAPRQDYNS